MNRTTPTLIAACLLASAFAVSAQSAPATAPSPADLQVAAQAGVDQADPGQSDSTVAATDKLAPGDRIAAQSPYNCLQYTGSRIRTADPRTGKTQCAQGPGRAYSRDDLERTGQVDLHDALRHLDPSIR
ncbi:hypothetical protein MNR01_16170 [Lysobacter sp. S4-A87]|uniref:hypothetical protein n=1 Tax=Lysobacter sp. S4-A87 TaxID=2925843 RepID=UPI001F532BE4|nr:hypothetical protein [Lysobacter sp. S4-A87]UNK49240.1 hypothetical protein MNR01_16170 [Lysobacter sp. S4-A87]